MISTFILESLPKELSDIEMNDEAKSLFFKQIERRLVARLLFIAYCEEGDITPCLPMILYQPTLSFKRAMTQHSMFIYQWYNHEKHQILHPEWKIHIDKDAKKKIIKDLRPFGLNQGTIFGDYDHIAKDIVEHTTDE